MIVREPAVAGMFYPGSDQACRRQIQDLLPRNVDASSLPQTICGGIAPHAGWTYSGRVAAQVFAAIAARTQPDVFVLFGAAHRRPGHDAALFPTGAWQTPLGLAHIDAPLAERVLAASSLVRADTSAHEAEHSIEVQVPFIQYLFPQARILPIIVEPSTKAVEIGRTVATAAQDAGASVVYIGSTDLTHYGPHYGFMPEGPGPHGLAWARQVNDLRIIELIRRMRSDAVVPETAEHYNACGAGAIAATLAACSVCGATQGHLLAHTTSAEVAETFGQSSTDAVGYAGFIFGINNTPSTNTPGGRA